MARKKNYGNQISIDTDRRWITWKLLYEIVYAESRVLSAFDFENVDKNGCKLREPDMIVDEDIKTFSQEYGKGFYISGDADFGKQLCGLKKYDFKKIPQIKNYDEFVSEIHQFHNFSLCPKTGNMNGKKGLRCGYMDVFPVYVVKLREYWNCDDSQKMEYVKEYLSSPSLGGGTKNYTQEQKLERFYKEDVPALCAYLDLFNDFSDYSKEVFFFGNKKYEKDASDLMDDIIKCGEKLDKREENDLEEYVRCAVKYWELKYKIIVDIYKKRCVVK